MKFCIKCHVKFEMLNLISALGLNNNVFAEQTNFLLHKNINSALKKRVSAYLVFSAGWLLMNMCVPDDIPM